MTEHFAEAYPLYWPDGWPRTKYRGSYNLFVNATFGASRDGLMAEIRRLGGSDVILSTNVKLRSDGLPYADPRMLDDPGVAIYFRRKGKRLAMARDAYVSVTHNLRSLAKAVEYLRGLERHGGAAMVERAFTGFTALPAPMAMGPTCWQVLGLEAPDHYEAIIEVQIERVFRELAKQLHPDLDGGDTVKMAQLNAARDEALRELKALI